MLYKCIHVGPNKLQTRTICEIEIFNIYNVLLLISKVSMLQFRVCICFFYPMDLLYNLGTVLFFFPPNFYINLAQPGYSFVLFPTLK